MTHPHLDAAPPLLLLVRYSMETGASTSPTTI
jgi:hypothetical protein